MEVKGTTCQMKPMMICVGSIIMEITILTSQAKTLVSIILQRELILEQENSNQFKYRSTKVVQIKIMKGVEPLGEETKIKALIIITINNLRLLHPTETMTLTCSLDSMLKLFLKQESMEIKMIQPILFKFRIKEILCWVSKVR